MGDRSLRTGAGRCVVGAAIDRSDPPVGTPAPASLDELREHDGAARGFGDGWLQVAECHRHKPLFGLCAGFRERLSLSPPPVRREIAAREVTSPTTTATRLYRRAR